MAPRKIFPPSHFLTPLARRLDQLRSAKREMTGLHLGRTPRSRLGRAPAGPTPACNVVGVGIGEKVIGGRPSGVLAVKFLVRIKYSKDQVPDSDRLPTDLGGLPVDVEQVGIFHRLAAAKSQAAAPAPALPNPRTRLRPFQPGCSVGFADAEHPSIMAGTFGFLATDGTAKRYVVSNNHVLANENRLALGGPIFQPGLLDGGDPATDRIASLRRFVALSTTDPNTVDCALAELEEGQEVSPAILFIGPPKGTKPAAIDMVVHKFGRTTGYRVGTITSVDTDLSVDYGLGDVTFHDQILVRGREGQAFSDSGDSGALVVERASGNAVGLLFAGSPSHSAASHIDDVLTALDIRLA